MRRAVVLCYWAYFCCRFAFDTAQFSDRIYLLIQTATMAVGGGGVDPVRSQDDSSTQQSYLSRGTSTGVSKSLSLSVRYNINPPFTTYLLSTAPGFNCSEWRRESAWDASPSSLPFTPFYLPRPSPKPSRGLKSAVISPVGRGWQTYFGCILSQK